MKITILGAGNIGSTLGGKWVQAGHQVRFGVRDPQSEKTRAAVSKLPDALVESIGQAIPPSEIILFAVPSAAVEGIVRENSRALAGKIVIDATNNFGAPVINSVLTILKYSPSARVYRAFNALGWEIFAQPQFKGTLADLFYCGPDDTTMRGAIERLIYDVGLRPIWVGGLDRMLVVDALGTLWVTLSFQRGMGRRLALKLLQE
ncbi:MAG: NAD(P)-binding domain-containing protein [Chloroflexi bacterium]|nr:NAD(P)-binding domain-containing protein [Chloroflexota bacterium]